MHEGGTKGYHVIRIDDSVVGGKGCVIRRWGKVGAIGQFKIGGFTSSAAASVEANKERANRLKKGYRLVNEFETDEFHTLAATGQHRQHLDDSIWMAHKEIYNMLVDWTEGQRPSFTSPEPEPLDETIDRGDMWGSW